MEIKQAKPGSAAAHKGLGLIDKQIAALKTRFLPYEPHLLNVATDDPFHNPYKHEYEKLPLFEENEKQLQYMTMISDGDRGVAAARGDWHDEIYNRSPGSADARSSTTTPNPSQGLKKPAVKMSISDYKNLKEKGIRPSPKPVAADAERKMGHSRNTSAVTAGTPMSRMSSLEGPVKQNGVNAAVTSNSEKMPSKETKPTAAQNSHVQQEKPRPTTNGHIPSNNLLQIKNAPKAPPKAQSPHPNNVQNHGLPPRPQSPPRKNPNIKEQPEVKQQKRPLESGDASQPPAEKRTKIEHSRTPSSHIHPLPRKPETPTGKLPPNLQKSQQPSPQPKKETPNKPNHARKTSSEKPLDLPPLLSPLPADLDNSPGMKLQPASGFSKKLESGKNSSQSTPSRFKVGSDTIVVKKPPNVESSPLSPPPKSPLAPLPTLLSPNLPQIVEDELVRLQQKSAEKAEKHAALSTAEARYEKSRQPDTPGVARKTITPKVGHPPKKNQGESSKPKPERLMVRLKYKKRQAGVIEKYLKLRPSPTKAFRELEKERIRSASKAPDTEDEDDVPLSKVTSKPTSAPVSKKRSSDSFESRTAEPAPKRVKGPEPIDVSKSHTKSLEPPFKSPALTAPSQKTLLSTPKKGDAMKSAHAMRRVDSNDGLSRTPQASTSTPASAEKPRINGERSVPPDPGHERLRADEKRFADSALRLKRKMDDCLKTKGSEKERAAITPQQRQLGVCYGVESLVTYMNQWSTQEKIRKNPGGTNWVDGVRLWEFVDGQARAFPVLSALSAQLGALFREEVSKHYVFERLPPIPPRKEKEGEKRDREKEVGVKEVVVEEMVVNERKREICWSAVSKGRPVLQELGVREVLGPWSSAAEAAGYVGDVLGRWERRERVGWKRDAGRGMLG